MLLLVMSASSMALDAAVGGDSNNYAAVDAGQWQEEESAAMAPRHDRNVNPILRHLRLSTRQLQDGGDDSKKKHKKNKKHEEAADGGDPSPAGALDDAPSPSISDTTEAPVADTSSLTDAPTDTDDVPDTSDTGTQGDTTADQEKDITGALADPDDAAAKIEDATDTATGGDGDAAAGTGDNKSDGGDSTQTDDEGDKKTGADDDAADGDDSEATKEDNAGDMEGKVCALAASCEKCLQANEELDTEDMICWWDGEFCREIGETGHDLGTMCSADNGKEEAATTPMVPVVSTPSPTPAKVTPSPTATPTNLPTATPTASPTESQQDQLTAPPTRAPVAPQPVPAPLEPSVPTQSTDTADVYDDDSYKFSPFQDLLSSNGTTIAMGLFVLFMLCTLIRRMCCRSGGSGPTPPGRSTYQGL